MGDGAVYLTVGTGNGIGAPVIQKPLDPGALSSKLVAVAGWGLFGGSQTTDGLIAYQQFHTSDNPYDPRFLKGWTGTATVGPLTPINTSNASPQQLPSDIHNL